MSSSSRLQWQSQSAFKRATWSFFFGAHFWSSLIFWSFLGDIFTFLDSGKMMIVRLVTWPLFLWTTLCGKSRKYRIFFTLWKLKNKTNLEAQNNWHWFWSKWNLIKSYSLKNLLVFLDFGFIIILAVTFKNFVSFKLEQSREILENLHLEKIDFFSSCIKKLEAKFLLIKYSRPKINWRFPKKAESILSIKYPKDCFNPIKSRPNHGGSILSRLERHFLWLSNKLLIANGIGRHTHWFIIIYPNHAIFHWAKIPAEQNYEDGFFMIFLQGFGMNFLKCSAFCFRSILAKFFISFNSVLTQSQLSFISVSAQFQLSFWTFNANISVLFQMFFWTNGTCFEFVCLPPINVLFKRMETGIWLLRAHLIMECSLSQQKSWPVSFRHVLHTPKKDIVKNGAKNWMKTELKLIENWVKLNENWIKTVSLGSTFAQFWMSFAQYLLKLSQNWAETELKLSWN